MILIRNASEGLMQAIARTLGLSGFVILTILGGGAAGASPERQTATSGEAIVKMLYHDYAWEALGDLGGTPIQQQSVAELEKYFDTSLAKLIREDRECVERTSEICTLNFNIIFDSQAPSAVDMEVASMNKNSEVKVHFTYPSDHSKIYLTYKMTNTSKGWRIRDVVYENEHVSLRTYFGK